MSQSMLCVHSLRLSTTAFQKKFDDNTDSLMTCAYRCVEMFHQKHFPFSGRQIENCTETQELLRCLLFQMSPAKWDEVKD